MTIMVTLQDPDSAALVRVPKADEYPGYDGWTFVTEEEWPSVQMIRDSAWGRVKALRAEKLLLAQTDRGVAQTDLESMVKISGLVSMAMLAVQGGSAFLETFTMADNSDVELDGEQMIAFGVQIGEHVAAVHAWARSLRSAIADAQTAAAVEAIDVTAGWP